MKKRQTDWHLLQSVCRFYFVSDIPIKNPLFFPAFLCAPGSLHFWKIAPENTGIPRSEEFLAHKFENPVSVQAVPGDCTNRNFRCEILSAARTETFNVKFSCGIFLYIWNSKWYHICLVST